MKLVRISNIVLLVLALVSSVGCAWQRVPELPQYSIEDPIPLNVGVVLSKSAGSSTYGPAVINDWRATRLFESLTYPYRAGDPVDAVMELSINGGWKGSGAGAGFVIGLTLGLAGTVMGPSMTGTHSALAVVTEPAGEVGRYSIDVTSKATWGMAANTEQVSKKADALQVRKLALELAQKIRTDRRALLSRLAK
jgi:hypothetical protein